MQAAAKKVCVAGFRTNTACGGRTPKILFQLISHKDPEKAKRATEAMLKMQKIDIATLKAAVGK